MRIEETWVVIGGADKGGIIVRGGEDLSSDKFDERLEYGALVQELELVGSRLHYRKISGAGPAEGWISTKLSGKVLAVRSIPPELSKFEKLEGDQPTMTFYAISDVHVECKENMDWLKRLPRHERSTAIVAGDLGVSLSQVKEALELFKEKFDHVFYCYGNHETWAHKSAADEELATYNDSYQKLDAIRTICDSIDVNTTPKLIENVWVVPVLGWYHKTWDTEPPLQPPQGKELQRVPPQGEMFATDTGACKWGGLKNGSKELAAELDKQNERWQIWPLPSELVENLKKPRGERSCFVLSFSHFLPRIELMPEKRFLFAPNLTQIVGSDFVRERVNSLQPDLHVFGHSHFPWDMVLSDGVRYKSWPLGTPAEQARRTLSYPTEDTENWHPLPVFDNLGRHYPCHPAMWFSLMYTRIKREPTSGHMASFVAASYCPEAPPVPENIISPGGNVPASDEEQQKRRDRYMGKAMGSMKKEVTNWSKASEKKPGQ